MSEIQHVNLDDYKQIGEGGNGKTYVNPAVPGEILKVNNARMSIWEAVKHEYDVSRAVADLGIAVPTTYRIVRVGKAFATISQRIEGKRSLSRICHDEPQRTEEMARLLCRKGKELFATECNTQFFPSRRDQALQAIGQFSFLSRKNRERLRTFVESIAEDSHCLHGDFQPGNIIQSGADNYWIDLDRFGHGDPMFDIGHLSWSSSTAFGMPSPGNIPDRTTTPPSMPWPAASPPSTSSSAPSSRSPALPRSFSSPAMFVN